MGFINRAAISQPQLPTLELREQEIMNMYQNKPRCSCFLTACLVRKPDSCRCLCQDIGQAAGGSHRYFSNSSSQQSQLEKVN